MCAGVCTLVRVCLLFWVSLRVSVGACMSTCGGGGCICVGLCVSLCVFQHREWQSRLSGNQNRPCSKSFPL